METIKRNSAEFKQVKEVLDDHEKDPRRKKVVLIYNLKSMDLKEKILLNTAHEAGPVVFDLAYETVLDYLRNRSKRLFREGKKPFYYFKSSAKSDYIEFPFEIAGKSKKELEVLF